MELAFSDEGFYCWGRESQGGTYLLRLIVNCPLPIRFGRFQAGKPVAVPQGDYLYVGSALAQKGAASLARRLLRHASRSAGQSPQPIRQKMLDLFPEIGLGATDDPGSTHLLRVTAVSDWWTSFPTQLSAFLRSMVA